MAYNKTLKRAIHDHMKSHHWPKHVGFGVKTLPGRNRDYFIIVLYKKSFEQMSANEQENYKESALALIRKLSLLTTDEVIWDWEDEFAPERKTF